MPGMRRLPENRTCSTLQPGEALILTTSLTRRSAASESTECRCNDPDDTTCVQAERPIDRGRLASPDRHRPRRLSYAIFAESLRWSECLSVELRGFDGMKGRGLRSS
jgi:hypothetical protein